VQPAAHLLRMQASPHHIIQMLLERWVVASATKYRTLNMRDGFKGEVHNLRLLMLHPICMRERNVSLNTVLH
jgi:hypothetical protein